MEKTNAEIATLAMLLKGINIKAGARKADCRPFIEKLDEHIDAFVKAAVEEGYAESEESHLPEVFPSADMRTAEFEEDIRRRAEYPESLFPMATDILCRRLQDWFRRELLLYVSDIDLSYGLKVEVSGLLTSSFSSDSMSPVSKQEAYIEKIQRLQQEGWTYQANHGSMELVDCPTNHVKIRQVVDSLGGRLYEVLLQRDRRHSHAWSGTAGLAWRSVLGKHPGVRPMSRLCLRTSRHPPRAEAPGFSRGVYDSPSV